MPSCWSCLVILEQGAEVCPFCGADQKNPVKIVNPDAPQPASVKSFFHHWGIVIVVLAAASGAMAGILCHSFGESKISPGSQAAGTAARSLREVREALSAYALSMKDAYPETLEALGDRTSLPTQAALRAGYRLQYIASPSANGGAPRGFVILGMPEKSEYLNLYIDESGVVRATQEHRAATVQDAPW